MEELLDKFSKEAAKKAKEYADEKTCYAPDSHLQYLITLKAFKAGAKYAREQVIKLLEEYYKNMSK